MRPAPVRALNPFYRLRLARSGKKLEALQVVGGWPYYTTFHDVLRAGIVVATPLTVSRLERVARAIEFPCEEIFLDGGAR